MPRDLASAGRREHPSSATSRGRRDVPTEPEEVPEPVVIAARREPAVWIGLGLLGLVLVVMSFALWRFSGQGPWPVPIVWAVGALVSLWLLTTREVRLGRGGVTIIRDTLGWRWTRRWPASGMRAVRVRCDHLPSRHQHGDGTPAGEARLLFFTVTLVGRPGLTLGFSRDVDAMEALARLVAGTAGLQALRRGYVRRAPDGLPLQVRKGAESPLA